jgi:asparagine synthetase B (glutamine-hydrolysing)
MNKWVKYGQYSSFEVAEKVWAAKIKGKGITAWTEFATPLEAEKMLPKLKGMFAFIIWDRVKKKAFAARDPYGIKPLYIGTCKRGLILASQVKTLLSTIGDKILGWLKSLRNKIRLERQYRKRLKELKKKDPFIYK